MPRSKSKQRARWLDDFASAMGDDPKALDSSLIPAHGESPYAFLERVVPGAKIPKGPRHLAVWDWAQAMEPESPSRSRVEIWGRGGAKSTIAEQICTYLGCSLKRRFVLYVCGTQDQADMHVQAIASLFESMGVPRAVNRYQTPTGWSASKLQTLNGFGVIGVGLNGRIRGARLFEFRPDLIILDDIDEKHDSEKATQKKLSLISSSVLAAGAPWATTLFIQNKIHAESAIARVADGRAEILLGAEVTLEPACHNLEVERTISSAGKPIYTVKNCDPTWPEGQDAAVIEHQINEWGIKTFREEAQHEDTPKGGLWSMEVDINPHRVAPDDVPHLTRLAIGVDPSGGTSTEAGVVAAGKDAAGHIYILADGSIAGSPNQWFQSAINLYRHYQADAIAVEVNFGGDIVIAAIRNAAPGTVVKPVRASRGKQVRADPIQQLAETGIIHHVGTFPKLEKELCTWQPGDDSPNRLDAMVWAATWLLQGGKSYGESNLR